MKDRKKLVQILAGLMALVMALTLILSIIPIGASAARSSSEIKEEINALKDEQMAMWIQMDELEAEQDANWESIEEMVEQKNNIDMQVGLLHSEILNINEQITAYSLLISEKQVELDAAQAKYDQLSEENKERIQAMEEEGTISYWSVLFKANSFIELIDQLNMMEEIAAADERRLAEMNAAALEVEAARDELAVEKTELEDSRKELDAAQAALEEKRAEADAILAELNAKGEEMDAMYEQMEAEEAELSASIAASEKAYNEARAREEEERRRREEEERRRQEEEERQNQQNSSNSSNNNSDNSDDDDDDDDSGSSGSAAGEGWIRPCSYVKLTSPYGWRTHPISGQYKFHSGVDLANSQGTPIYAVRSGTVTTARYNGSYGYYVTINHGDGYSTLYAHLTHYIVSSGDRVSQGQVIGYMGSTGNSTGPHLHYQVFYEGSTVNPAGYL